MTDHIKRAIERIGWHTTLMGNQRTLVFAPGGEGGKYPLTTVGYLDERWVVDAIEEELNQLEKQRPEEWHQRSQEEEDD